MIVKIYIGNDLVTLYKDESISITSSVLDISDITKNTTDYTKSFTVPANENNNKIFKHYYNANIDNTFDARIKVDGRIELNGIPFRVGKFLLQKVKIKQGKPSSYTINFWGNLVSISDSVGKDELTSLDLTAFSHPYNSSNVKLGLTTNTFTNGGAFDAGDLIYNLIAKKQYYYTSDLTDTTQTDALTNIHYNASAGTGVIWNDLRPSLKLIKIIEAIETDYNLSFSRDFFGRSEFTELFMWMNNEQGNAIGGGTEEIDFTSGDTDNVNLTTNVFTFFAFNTSASNDEIYWELGLNIYTNVANAGKEITVITYNNDEIIQEQTIKFVNAFGSGIAVSWLRDLDNQGIAAGVTYKIRYEIKSDTEITFWTSLFQYKKGFENVTYQTDGASQTITSQFNVANNLPKIKIIDFLKGIFQMFKLIVIPKDNGVIYVNTLKDYYLQGQLYDITRYINWESYDVSRGDILSEINYNFQEPKTIANLQFKENTSIAYGDLEAIIRDSTTNEVLEGSKAEIKLPFEQFIYDRLIDLDTGESTSVVYSAIIDEKKEAVNPKPHIFYNINNNLSGQTIGFINDVGISEVMTSTINIPSHVNDLTTKNYSTVFGEEFNEYDGVKITNTLYSNYHEPYITQVFNIKRRNFIFDVATLPLKVLLNLELNDMLRIKDDYFRIDKFTTDLVTRKTQLELINSFEFTLYGFSTANTNISLSKEAQTYTTYVTNLSAYTVAEIDAGFGTGWITTTDDGSGNLIFTVLENTFLRRYIYIEVTDTSTLQKITFYVNQKGIIVKADNDTITSDTNLITADYV